MTIENYGATIRQPYSTIKPFMSWSKPSQHPKFLSIKNKYRKLKQPYKDEISKLAQDKERIWSDSSTAKKLEVVGNYIAVGNGILFNPTVSKFFPILLLIALAFELYWLCYPFLLCLFWALLNLLYDLVVTRLRSFILAKNQDTVSWLQQKTMDATAKLNVVRQDYGREWTQSCENHVGRPPDWSDRRAQVLARDGYKCTKCGYPEGFKRRSRELHVHHVIHISNGGDNDMNNLVTLCHICHRSIDEHHRSVRKMSKGVTKKRW